MKLEVISRRPAYPNAAPPLLFIHGANSGAWVWEQHFLDDMAERGFEAHALSLRGHGESDGRVYLPFWSLNDFLEDVDQVVATLDQAPILIGHSMGGMIAQKYLQYGPCAGAVLMGSVPPLGLVHTGFDMAWRNPLLFQQISLVQMFGPIFPWADSTVRQMLFSDAMPEREITRLMAHWQPESLRAAMDMMWGEPPWHRHNTVPVLALGTEEDKFTPPNLVEATARHYHGEVRILSGIGHAMMLEPGWRQVTDAIADWVDDHFLQDSDMPAAGSGEVEYAIAASAPA